MNFKHKSLPAALLVAGLKPFTVQAALFNLGTLGNICLKQLHMVNL